MVEMYFTERDSLHMLYQCYIIIYGHVLILMVLKE
uniref:Uncharacterized protein n=1 Tax=Ciona intestinalis TaxID=7719 RepID=H2XWY0_CIOIN